MMQNKLFLLIFAFFFTISIAKADSSKDKYINLDKFSGFWFEIARAENYAQKKCNYSALNYKYLTDTELEITNLCITFDDIKKKITNHASLINKNETNRTFYIEYTPFMGFIKPFSKGNFHIFYVNDDYTIAIVGTPDKSNFWILSRELLEDEEVKKAISLARSLGLNLSNLVFDDFSVEKKDEIIKLFN